VSIYVDEIRKYETGLWCHMWTDEADVVLDSFAQILGLLPKWSHISYGMVGRFYHYDLRPTKRKLALKHGAMFMPLTDWIKSRVR